MAHVFHFVVTFMFVTDLNVSQMYSIFKHGLYKYRDTDNYFIRVFYAKQSKNLGPCCSGGNTSSESSGGWFSGWFSSSKPTTTTASKSESVESDKPKQRTVR